MKIVSLGRDKSIRDGRAPRLVNSSQKRPRRHRVHRNFAKNFHSFLFIYFFFFSAPTGNFCSGRSRRIVFVGRARQRPVIMKSRKRLRFGSVTALEFNVSRKKFLKKYNFETWTTWKKKNDSETAQIREQIISREFPRFRRLQNTQKLFFLRTHKRFSTFSLKSKLISVRYWFFFTAE